MLFIIDMQNEYVDKKNGGRYVRDSEKIVDGIIGKIKEYEEKSEFIFYTSDLSTTEMEELLSKRNRKVNVINNKETINQVENHSTNRAKWSFEPYHLLKPYLKNHKLEKKSYYALPPETLLEIQNNFKDKGSHTGTIEFVGVETHKCILANAICIQSAFPKANIVINASLCKSNNQRDHKKALQIMESLGMEIRR